MSNTPPLISVIVTTFNRCKMLNETLDSILSQTFADFELLIVDNMSTDETEAFVNALPDKRIRYFRHPNHGVIAINRNYAIQRAQGMYIAFCDDDDLWIKEKLAIQVSLMQQKPEIALCYSQATSFLGETVLKEKMIRRRVTAAHFYNLLQGNYIPNSSVLVKTEVFKQVGYLNESPTLREDYEMWLRVARYFGIEGIDASLIMYRVHPNNLAGSKVAETQRAIRTLKSVVGKLGIPLYAWITALCIHYLKLFYYKFSISFSLR